MASNDKQLFIILDGQQVQVSQSEEAPVSISYVLEDVQDFEQKGSATAFDLTVPAVQVNQRLFNAFHDPNSEDTTSDGYYRKPRVCSIIAAGVEVFKGKALLQSGTHTDRPEAYTFDCFGSNGDWMLDLQDTTLWDGLPSSTHVFNAFNVGDSWNFDGTNPAKTWVYAPVRYFRKFGGDLGDDTNIVLTDLRPSLFVYWIIRRVFDSIGYSLQSAFFDTNFFRRATMPWTWGTFLGINSKLGELLLFKATGPVPSTTPTFVQSAFELHPSGSGTSAGGVILPGAGSTFTNFELSNTLPTLGFDNNSNYSYDSSSGECKWTYKSINGVNFGTITGRFGVSTSGGVKNNNGSNSTIYIDVYKNGALLTSHTQYTGAASNFGPDSDDLEDGRVYNFSVTGLNVGDTVIVKFRYTYFKSSLGSCALFLTATSTNNGAPPVLNQTVFQMFGFSIEPGGIVDFKQYSQFKNYKFLDMLRGLVDHFNLEVQTDSVNKVICFEPQYPHMLNDGTSVVSDGYFTTKRLNWSRTQDLSKESTVTLFSDSERELNFKHKADSNNGGVNIHNNRFSVEAGASKYMLSERFRKGKKDLENRFFAAPMHYNADQFKPITGVSPQFMAFIPENISNTSASEEETVFEPVLAYYKGQVNRAVYGGWRFDGNSGMDLPYMFAVSYKSGGQNEPILTYSDQQIPNGTGGFVLGRGLMKRFFLQRLAVMEYGKLYQTWMHLNNNDVTNWLHREAIMINGAAYYLVGINDYKPLLPVSCQCNLWKYTQPTQANVNACYPSQTSVLTNPAPSTLSSDDIPYASLLLKTPDIP